MQVVLLKLCHSSLSYLNHWASFLEFHMQTHHNLNTLPISRILFLLYILMQLNKKFRLGYNIKKCPVFPLLLHPLRRSISSGYISSLHGGFVCCWNSLQEMLCHLSLGVVVQKKTWKAFFPLSPQSYAVLRHVLTVNVGRVSSSKIEKQTLIWKGTKS